MMLLGRTNVTEEQHFNSAEKVSQENLCVDDDCSGGVSLRSCLSTNTLSSIRSNNCKMRPRNVSFHEVNVREYETTVSDNPSVSNGVPIGIDWIYQEQQAVCVNKYEEGRSPKADRGELKIPAIERRTLLKNIGFSAKEIQQAARDATIIKRKRRDTNNMTPAMEKTSIVMEKVSRNIFKMVSLNSSKKKLNVMMKESSKYSIPKRHSVADFTKVIVTTSTKRKILSRTMSMPEISESEGETSEEEVRKNHDIRDILETNNTVNEVPFSSSDNSKRKMESGSNCLLDRNMIEKMIMIPTDCDDIDDFDVGMDIDF